MNANSSNIGALISAKLAVEPKANAAGTRNGVSIDRLALGVSSCVLAVLTGASTGTPTTLSVDVKLQDSADGTTFADFATAVSATAVSSSAEKDIDLTTARQYVRAVETVSFTGGTAPTVLSSAALVFGGATTLPL